VVLLAAIRGHLSPHQATAILTVAAVGCVFVLLLPPVWSRLVASDAGNVTFRVDVNESAIAMWRANPVLGVGLNLFPENVGDYDVRHVSLYRWPVHNIYLLWLAETGIVGAAGMGVYVIWGFYRAWRASGDEDAVISLLAIGFVAGAVGLYVGELVSFSTRLESIAQAFAILLGTVIATSRHVADAPPRQDQ
jgi:O-antigen ligase